MSGTTCDILSLGASLVTATQIAHMVQKCMAPSQLTCCMRAELRSLYISEGIKKTLISALTLTA